MIERVLYHYFAGNNLRDIGREIIWIVETRFALKDCDFNWSSRHISIKLT